MTGGRSPGPSRWTARDLVALTLAGALLAGIGAAGYRRVDFERRASAAAAAVNAVRDAAYAYHRATGEWPADGAAGELPLELAPYLPDGFAFRGDGYALDWENWRLAPARAEGSPERLLAVSLIAADDALGRAVDARVRPTPSRFTLDHNHTFILATT